MPGGAEMRVVGILVQEFKPHSNPSVVGVVDAMVQEFKPD